jgi:hypothetical protein
MFQFPVSARHEHRAERSERDGIPGEATKVKLFDLFQGSVLIFGFYDFFEVFFKLVWSYYLIFSTWEVK